MAKVNKKVALGVGAGLATVAALGAGYYFFGSKNSAQHRKKAVRWANDLKTDVLRGAKKLKKLDEKAYKTIVDESMKAYAGIKSIDKDDLARAGKELKQNWKRVEAEMKRVERGGEKEAKRVAKKVVRTARRVLPKKVTPKKVTRAKKKK